jgi:UrcA family protein
MNPEDKPFTPQENIMKTFTLRDSKNVLFAAAAAMSLTSLTQVAQASEVANDRPALTVRYSDLNLDTQAGAAALYQRIRHAAEQVCGKDDSRGLDGRVAVQMCVDNAVASSVSAVGNAQLTRQYTARAGKAPKQVFVASLR